MKNILAWFFLFLFWIFQTFASDAPSWLKLDSSTQNTATISWDSVEGAFWYYVSYGTESWYYETELSDIITDTSIELSNLSAQNTYFLVVQSLDMETGEESSYSDEFEFSLNQPASQSESIEKFKLLEVEANYTNRLVLTFNYNLQNSETSVREFKIVNTNNQFDEVEVLSSYVDPENSKKVILDLADSVQIGNEYALTIINIVDIKWNNIESWVDSQELFYVAQWTTEYSEYIAPITPIDNTQMNSASEDNEITSNEWIWGNRNEVQKNEPAGTSIPDEDIPETTLSAASESDELPQTGPEHVLIFILTVIIASLFFVLHKKKI